MKAPPEILAGTYLVCLEDKVGIYADLEESPLSSDRLKEFGANHPEHALELVPSQIFLSDHLTRDFTDVERPNLEPIVLAASEPRKTSPSAPFGPAKTFAETVELNRRVAREKRVFEAEQPIMTVHPSENRPLLRTVTTNRDKFESFFWKWHNKIDTGVPHHLIGFVEGVFNEQKTLAWANPPPPTFRVHLRSDYLRSSDDATLEHAAITEITRIAAMQRFGAVASLIETWLCEQVAILIQNQEDKEITTS